MKKLISNIIFTKNRPLQLEGYLDSLYKYFPAELIQTYILYKPELFSHQYQQVFKKYNDCRIIEENDFSTDFFKILNQIQTRFILFGIDDVIYFDSVDMAIIEKCFDDFPEDIFGFSLRFSPQSLKDSNDLINDLTVSNQQVYRLNWKNGQNPHARYPFELCCTIYPTHTVKKIIHGTMNNNPVIKKIFSPDSPLIKVLQKTKFARKTLKSFGYFFSPNTLESWNCRWCQNNSSQLPLFTYFQKLCATAIQVNLVNTSTRNTFDGSNEHTVEALNDKYKQGYRLDINFLATNKPISTHCGQELFKTTRNNK